MITIFTPTYNRAYIIDNLYQSLCNQTNDDFEWLIVDDGSTDNTQQVINNFILENKLRIKYITQSNGGKHRAINKGVKEANGELFFIVDSDDCLAANAVERIIHYYSGISHDSAYAGVSGLRFYPDGKRIGGEVNFSTLDCSSLDFRMKYKIRGDMAEIFRTEILRVYPFPEIEGEKFCPEALVWNRISQHYKLRYFNEKIYLCNYLSDGLTAKIIKIRRESPISSMTYYSELYRFDIPFIQKIKAAINFWRFRPLNYNKQASFKMFNIISLFVYPIGKALRVNDKRYI